MHTEIDELNSRTLKGYHDDPSRIRGDFGHENSTKNDYIGREIFELLQNAVDALDGKEDSRVEIRVTDTTLEILNTGSPFTSDGIDSLRIANNSSKKESSSYIGSKGLGFRSLLNWTNTIEIHSNNNLSVSYDKKQTTRFFNDNGIAGENFAVLSYARQIDPKDLYGYATRIILYVDPNKRTELQNQLQAIDEATLLFLPRIKTLTINNKGASIVYRKRLVTPSRNEDVISIITDTNERIFTVYKSFGNVYDPESREEKRYEIQIADSENSIASVNYLYSYFRTEIPLPIGFLIHATLDLESDRNGIVKTEINNEILQRTIDFLFEVAEKKSKTTPSYATVERLIPHTDLDSRLDVGGLLQFASYYKDIFKKAKIFPSHFDEPLDLTSERYYLAQDTLYDYIDDDFPQRGLLAKSVPKALIEYTSYVEQEWANYVKKNDINPLSLDILGPYIETKRKDYSLDEKTVLPKYILEEFNSSHYDSDKLPNIFIDSKGSTIKNGNIYLSPGSDGNMVIPDFIRISTLHPEQEIIINDYRTFTLVTDGFGVHDYDIGEIIKRCNSSMIVERDADKLRAKQRKYITFIQEIDSSDDFDLMFCSRSGELKSSKDLYMGREYGEELCEALLGSEDGLFIEGSEYFTKEAQPLKSLFLKHGVASSPRLNKSAETAPVAARSLKLHRFDREFYKYKTYDHLDDILNNAPEDRVIEWLLNTVIDDNHQERHFRLGPQGGTNELEARGKPHALFDYIGKQRIFRRGDQTYSLSDVVLVPELGTKVDFLLGMDLDDYFKLHDIRHEGSQAEKFKEKFKIANNFSKISTENLYRLLNRLPEIDHSGSISKKLYNTIDSLDLSVVDSYKSDEKAEYFRTGKVFSKKLRYVSNQDAKYAIGSLPSTMAMRFDYINIPFRRNAERIEKILGVKLLDTKIEIKTLPTIVNRLRTGLSEDIKNLKIYVLAEVIRAELSLKEQSPRKISNINILPALGAEAIFGDDDFPLEEFNFGQFDKDYYIVIPGAYTSVDTLKTKVAYNQAIAEIFQQELRITEELRKSIESYVGYDPDQRYAQLVANYGDDEYFREAKKMLGLTSEAKIEQTVDYVTLNIEKLNQFKVLHSDSYEMSVYKKLEHAELSEQERYFELMSDYADYVFPGTQDVPSNHAMTDQEMKDSLQVIFPWIDFAIRGVDTQALGIKTKADLAKSIGEDNDRIEEFLNKDSNESILRFGRLEELMHRWSREVDSSSHQKDEGTASVPIQIELAEDITLLPVDGDIASGRQPVEPKKGRIKRHIDYMAQQKNRDSNARAAEKSVYDLLINNSAYRSVRWISSYAKEFDASRDINDGAGYDISFIEDGVIKYVEVKSVNLDKIEFYMSINEYNFASNNKANYYLYLVDLGKKNGTNTVAKEMSSVLERYQPKVDVYKFSLSAKTDLTTLD